MGPAHDDPYRVLGIARSASYAEAKRAYDRLSRVEHPDRHPQDEPTQRRQNAKMAELNDALALLGKDKGRVAAAPPPPGAAPQPGPRPSTGRPAESPRPTGPGRSRSESGRTRAPQPDRPGTRPRGTTGESEDEGRTAASGSSGGPNGDGPLRFGDAGSAGSRAGRSESSRDSQPQPAASSPGWLWVIRDWRERRRREQAARDRAAEAERRREEQRARAAEARQAAAEERARQEQLARDVLDELARREAARRRRLEGPPDLIFIGAPVLPSIGGHQFATTCGCVIQATVDLYGRVVHAVVRLGIRHCDHRDWIFGRPGGDVHEVLGLTRAEWSEGGEFDVSGVTVDVAPRADPQLWHYPGYGEPGQFGGEAGDLYVQIVHVDRRGRERAPFRYAHPGRAVAWTLALLAAAAIGLSRLVG